MLTPSEWKTLGYLVAIGLTVGGFIAVIVFFAACALSGLHDPDPDPNDIIDLQDDPDAWRPEPSDTTPPARLHPTLRESGYYGTAAHQARAAKVDRAMGCDHAA